MRVLFVTNLYPPHHFGGYEVMCKTMADGLRAAGHEVQILASSYRHAENVPDHEPVLRTMPWYDPVHRDGYWYGAPLRDRLAIEYGAQLQLWRCLGGFRPHLVCYWNLGGLPVSLLRSPVASACVLADDWPLWAPRADMWHQTLLRHPRLARLARMGNPDLWLAASRYVALETGVHPFVVVHPGVDATFAPPATPEPWSGRLLYVGRVEPRKGVATAIAALDGTDYSLRVVGHGDPDYIADLQEQASGRNVTFTGALGLQELADEYRRADALLFPVEWEEPWGLVPLEAMASGLPVIATGSGGSGEYLEDGRNCLLFTRGDAAGLSAAIAMLGSDDALRQRLRSAGLDTATQHSAAQWVAQVDDALRDLRARPRRSLRLRSRPAATDR